MEIKLLNRNYKNNEKLYKDFISNKIIDNQEYFSGETVFLEEIPSFPIYMAHGSDEEKKNDFLESFNIISEYYLDTDRDIHFAERFWHSLFCVYKRDYILQKYPKVKKGMNYFNNIVLKNFDWENYIYKCVLGAQYVNDNIDSYDERNRYYEIIVDNLDIYNYIIKYEIFRNDSFLIKILDIIDDWGLSKILKSKIEGRDDLGEDARVGRRVIFEFNKSYPIIMSPMLDKEDLENLFIEYMGYYTDELKVNNN